MPDYLAESAAIQCVFPGKSPGDEEIDLNGGGSGQLDWRLQLRRYVGLLLEPRPVFNRPSRRFPELVGIIPGRRRQASRPRIMAVIDTSGSVTEEMLEMISGELQRLARDFSVTVVECDAVIQDVYPFRPIKHVKGRCGTDFRPPLEAEFLRQQKPDVVVYFTDGCGPAPDVAPAVPVVWCLLPDEEPPVAWGKVIRMVGISE